MTMRDGRDDALPVTGTCHVLLALDLGFAIDVGHAERLLSGEGHALSLKRPRLLPEPAQIGRRSTRLSQAGAPLELGGAFTAEGTTEIVLWGFGAATIGYRIALDCALSSLCTLSDLLWDHSALLSDARRRAAELLGSIGAAVDRPHLGDRVEDYVVFELRLPEGAEPTVLCGPHARTTAGILRAEPLALSDEEVEDALAVRCAYAPDELVLIDWFAAMLVGRDMGDQRLVLELAVAELLELRVLDAQLDRAIEAAYAVLGRRGGLFSALRSRAADLALVSELQADAALLFEGADNALNLLGDQYLARLYRLAARRFHFEQWDAGIERKLRVLDGIYDKLATQTGARRLEVLEVVIVLLIALEAGAALLPRLLR